MTSRHQLNAEELHGYAGHKVEEDAWTSRRPIQFQLMEKHLNPEPHIWCVPLQTELAPCVLRRRQYRAGRFM